MLTMIDQTKFLSQEMTRYAQAERALQQIEQKIEEQTEKIRENYAERIKKWMAIRAKASELFQTFAFNQYDEVFASDKKIELQEGTIGFRKSKHKVVKHSSLSWQETYEKLAANLPEYLRINTSLDETKILTDQANKAKMTALEKIGISVVQDEYFYIKLNNNHRDPV